MLRFKLLISIVLVYLVIALQAQIPQQINYQAIVHNALGATLPGGTSVSVRFQIHDGSPLGSVVYQETSTVATNQFGLITYAIGSTGNLSVVNWANGSKYLQIEIDPTGGVSFTDMGTNQLLSVPYALFAGNIPAQGVAGATGANGQNGINGLNGATGATGSSGLDGANGATGVTGVSAGSLDTAYNFGGGGQGRIITANNGAVKITGTDGLLVTGSPGSGVTAEINGGGTRMFFNPNKSAFRAGSVGGSQWNNANIGKWSTAFGNSTTASSLYATAFGDFTNASAPASTAMGDGTTASGSISTAMGLQTTASGTYATALGFYTIASGGTSIAMGNSTTAPSYIETAIGSFNTNYNPVSTTAWDSTDRLFVIGNGITGDALSDAIVVLKSGYTGIGTSTPTVKLDVETDTISPAFKLVDGTQGAGKVLTSDTAGNATWQTMSHYLGQYYGGGIIFWVDSAGQHGLITSDTDQSIGAPWYNGSFTTTNAVRNGVGSGSLNTERIIANQGVGSYAAQICATYQGGNYGDWYLPSIYELSLLIQNQNVLPGGLTGANYWSSSEADNQNAMLENYNGTVIQPGPKQSTAQSIRAIRAF